MPSVTLLEPSTYTLKNLKFLKGKKQTVTTDVAAYLDGNRRFKIDWEGATPPEKPVTKLSDYGSAAPEEEEETTLLEAIDLVDIDTEENFEEDGKPTVKALSEIMGREVSVEERDAAMAKSAEAGSAPTIESASGQPAGRTRIIRRPKATGAPDPSTEGAQEV